MADFGTGLTLAEFLLQESEADLVTVKLSGSACPCADFPRGPAYQHRANFHLALGFALSVLEITWP
jgi:hypothetical protein